MEEQRYSTVLPNEKEEKQWRLKKKILINKTEKIKR